MIVFPNAKINIGLNIVSKRPDGYHNLETIFYPINICDALEITYHSSINRGLLKDKLTISGLSIDSQSENNLVFKAVQLLRSKGYQFPILEIDLLKKIPMGAGIGGGSSDATHTLLLINDLFNLKISKLNLIELSSQLGADCAFFVDNKSKYAEGIGDLLEDIELDLSEYYIYIVKPNVFVSTKDAFDNVNPSPSILLLKEMIKQPISEWRNTILNDFELSIFPKFSIIKEIKEKFYKLGVEYSSMSGSGASVYALSKHPLIDFEKHFKNCYLWCNKNEVL